MPHKRDSLRVHAETSYEQSCISIDEFFFSIAESATAVVVLSECAIELLTTHYEKIYTQKADKGHVNN